MLNRKIPAAVAAFSLLAGSMPAGQAGAVVVVPPPQKPVAAAAALPQPAQAPQAPVAQDPVALPVTAPATIRIPEGTEFRVRTEDALSSKTAQDGQRFTITLSEDVTLGDGTILRAGYRGIGEVVEARKNGMMGKTGKLQVTINYIKVGDQRIRLRANKTAQGDHRTGAQVVTVVLVGVFAGLIKGKNTEIPRGTEITAYTDQEDVLKAPFAPPPPEA